MRFAFADGFGCALSFVARVIEEGHEALYYIDPDAPPTQNLTTIGEGLVPKETSYDRFTDWAKAPNTIAVFCSSGMGEKAEALRASGVPILGGGTFMDKLEKDRRFGTEIAQNAGCLIPPYEEFESLSECANWAQALGETECFFKSDRYFDKDSSTHRSKGGDDLQRHLRKLRMKAPDRTRCIVQKKMDGVAFSTGRWWNGNAWIGPFENTIEHQAFMNDDIGPGTGCSLNAIWFTPESKIAEALGWENLTASFREHHAPPGLYDINSVVDKQGRVWFLEWTPRFGYDSEPTGFRLYGELSALFEAVALGTGESSISSDIAYSTRLTLAPYPWEHGEATDKHTCIGQAICGVDGLYDGNFVAYQVRDDDDELVMASPEGIVGLSLAVGDDLADLNDEAVEFAKSLTCSSALQYRTDGAAVIAKDAKAIEAAGYPMHPGLLERTSHAA